MKNIFIVILTLITCSAFAYMNIENDNSGMLINYSNDNHEASLDFISKVVALPAESVDISVIQCEVAEYDSNGEFVSIQTLRNSNNVQLVRSFVMRELYAHEIKIDLVDDNEKGRTILDNVTFRISPVNEIIPSQTVSMAFLPLYKSLIDNFDDSYLRDAVVVPSSMLIITHAGLDDTLAPFLDWKHAKGITTEVVTLDETGPTNTDIKNYIQNIYDTSDTPPDYLLLLGDVDDDFAMPSYYYSSENNVSDNPYTLLAGDDYFPEMLVGRFSFDIDFELQTIIAKILMYEKTPYMGETGWFKRALLIAGNYSSSPPVPTTPVEVSKWLKDLMYLNDYENVDEVYYPPTYPGTSQIVNSIDGGVGFVSYRGWGDANGWHYPHFKRDDINDLNNGWRLPVVTSIVCNTGDFANSVDPCFGEAFMTTGSPQTPSGAVAVMGPSDLHTSTKFNNAIFSGFYGGMFNEGIMSFGAAVLRGKQELYDNYPLNREPGGKVEFYFYVYNILSDPSLTMWSEIPAPITLADELPDQVAVGTTHLDVNFIDMNGAIVTAANGDFLDIAIVEDDYALLDLNPGAVGEYKITITKPNFKPLIHPIEIIQTDNDLGINDITIDGELFAGSQVEIQLTIHNYGNAIASDVSAELITDCPFIDVITPVVDCGNIEVGGESIQTFTVDVDATCPDGNVVEFALDMGDFGAPKFDIVSKSLLFEVVDFTAGDGFIHPGDTADIQFSIKNISLFDANSVQAEIVTLSDAVQINSGIIDLGDVTIGSTINGSFNVTVASDCFVGRAVGFILHLTDSAGQISEPYFVVEIGEVESTDPTFSPDMDYYCYDSFDTEYSEVPTYEWLEIDPRDGGDGEVTLLPDDASYSTDLPFTFTYFGNNYDSLTICTNGWISFETTWMDNFRNWRLPSAIGPFAMVAPYWDDLIGEPFGLNMHHDMRICHYYNTDENTYIIEWNDCFSREDEVSVEKFQIVLYDPIHHNTLDGNGIIQFNYQSVNNPDFDDNYSTVGIESPNQTKGILYTFADIYAPSASVLQDGMAIKFTTNPPDTYTDSDNNDLVPVIANLNGNYPNPFNPVTTISYSVPSQSDVNISIYNVKGQLIRNLVDSSISQGDYSVIWDGLNDQNESVTSGVYFYRLKVGNIIVESKKCLLLK